VQAKLWKVICQLAQKLNIRIFVTTHSRDTIGALQQVAFADGYAEDIRVLKLKFSPKTRRIKPAEFEIGNVKLALEQGIEIR
jgi:predicted ATP-dependent endonuclease of OLD family